MKGKESLAVGGQAVLEGVMFKSADKVALAVRQPDGTIHVEKKLTSTNKRKSFYSWPIFRGAINLVDALKIGVEMLTLSANLSEGEEGEQLGKRDIFLAVFVAIAASIGLFFVLPTVITGLLDRLLGQELILKSLIEGLIRLAIFLVYVTVISKMKEIYRVFQYHGAEHMVIHCYENEEALTVENVKKFKPLHKRCGTSFLLLVMVVSILVFSLLPWMSILPRILLRIVVVPLIAGLAYEVTRFAGKSNSSFVNLLMAPGLMLQNLTTRQPDEKQIEVAIKALEGILSTDSNEIDTQNTNLYNKNEIACEAEV